MDSHPPQPPLSLHPHLAPPPPPPQPQPPVLPFQFPFPDIDATAPLPSLNQQAPTSLSHPSYSEMILAAVSALNEKGGSTKRSIANYIEQAYANLPPTHSALLSHHLDLMKNSGQLVMVKNSYKLPGSGSEPGDAASAGVKRGRGRPPKAKPVDNNGHSGFVGFGDGANWAPASPKRRPGRPPKQPMTVVPLIQANSEAQQPNESAPDVSVGNGLAKRRPGRPPKKGRTLPLVGGQAVSSGGRPRGRPRKNVLGAVSTKLGQTLGKRPGRPPKRAVADGGSGGGVLAMVGVKRRGLPPRSGRPKKLRTTTGRPVGRPRKNASAVPNLGPSQAQGNANEALKRKLEHIQMRIRDAVDTLKPYFTDENEMGALSVLQQLEELATMPATS